MSFVDEIWGFWPDFTELISILNLLPPDIKYAYSILFSMHFLWYWRRIKYAQKSASSQIGDNFRLSHDFIVWFRDTVVWHSLQIKWMIRLRSLASFTSFFYSKLSLIYGIVSTVWQFGWREDGENEFSIVLLVTFPVFLTSIPHFAERHLAPDLLRHSQAKDFSPEGQDGLKWRPREKMIWSCNIFPLSSGSL